MNTILINGQVIEYWIEDGSTLTINEEDYIYSKLKLGHINGELYTEYGSPGGWSLQEYYYTGD